jgi:hypothetical protein
MKKFFIAICLMASVFDAISVMLGVCVAGKIHTLLGYVISGVAALMILALMLSARDAWCRDDIVHKCIRIFWALALMANVATVFFATGNHIILQMPLSNSVTYEWNDVYAAGALQLSTIAVMTIFLTAAPVGLSFLWGTFFEDVEDLDEALKRGNQKPSQAAS